MARLRVIWVVVAGLVWMQEGRAHADCPAAAVRHAASTQRVYISGPVTCTLGDLDPLLPHAALERTSRNDPMAEDRSRHPLRNMIVGNSVGGAFRNLILKRADETQVIANVFGPTHDFDFDVSGPRLDVVAFELTDGQATVLAGNVFPDSTLIHTVTSQLPTASTIITRAGFGPAALAGRIWVDTSVRAHTIFRETQDVTHEVSRNGSAGTQFPARATPTESTLTVDVATFPRPTRVRPYHARPASGSVLLTPLSSRGFRVRSEAGDVSVEYTVSQLAPNTAHAVERDGEVVLEATSNDDGVLVFTDTAGAEEAHYEIRPAG